ncbi:hypothetical protein [Rhizobium sp. PP-F2F-G48]|uniref:hypothetical protein n=1 Tax=Rhizobium sp. PP-F2F-G48 TaxID=2135651 RepID=UPI00104D3DEE|nr:hypothetical protein [Rhizobium sp. PP-F2F-G48]
MTSEQLRELAWDDKERHVLESLRRKVAIIVKFAENPSMVVAGLSIPRERKQLREWVDPERGLWPWKWPALDNPDHPKNGALIELFWAALDKIDAGPQDSRTNLQQDLRDREAIIARQKQQIAELTAENVDLRKKAYGRR